MRRVRLWRQIELDCPDDMTVDIGADEEPFAISHRAENTLPIFQRLLPIEGQDEANEEC